MALECELLSLNQIIIGAKQPARARLVGGRATATMQLRVPLLGSSKAGMTHVVVGVNHVLDEQMKELALRLEKEKGVEDNLQKLVKHLTTAGDPKGMLERVKASLAAGGAAVVAVAGRTWCTGEAVGPVAHRHGGGGGRGGGCGGFGRVQQTRSFAQRILRRRVLHG